MSNGNGTPQVLEYLRPWVDLYKVDLKSFDDRHYRELGGRLAPILDTIRRLHAMGVWVEIVTLLIPGFNDSRDELTRLTDVHRRRVAGHPVARHRVSRRLQDDRPGEHDRRRCCCDAAAIGRASGLRYVYAGNLPGAVGDLEDTHCAACGDLLIARYGYHIRSYRLTPDGRCPSCAAAVPGRWDSRFDGQIASQPFLPGRSRLTNPSSLMNDTLGRPLRNLRLSVTDRCNLRCEYCMPEDDYVWLPREDVLHFEEISALVDVFLALGVDKIRLTGGEPLLRRDLAGAGRA